MGNSLEMLSASERQEKFKALIGENLSQSDSTLVEYENEISVDDSGINGNKSAYNSRNIVTIDSNKALTVEEIENADSIAESVESQLCDDRDDCDNLKPIYENWEDLKTELASRIMQAGKLNRKGKYEMRCPNHNDKNEISLFFNPNAKKINCLAGCPD